MAKINIDVPKDLKKRLASKAKQMGVSQSALVRIAISNYLWPVKWPIDQVKR